MPQVDAIAREAFPEEPSPPSFKRLLRDPSRQRFLVACIEEPEHASQREHATTKADIIRIDNRWQWLKGLLRLGHGSPPSPPVRSTRVVGYIGMEIDSNKGHIIDIAVNREFQRRGIGELLLRSMVQEALLLGASFLTLEVRASNIVAQSLYGKYGFSRVERRPEYYIDRSGQTEDGYFMSTGKITAATYHALLENLTQGPPCIETQASVG